MFGRLLFSLSQVASIASNTNKQARFSRLAARNGRVVIIFSICLLRIESNKSVMSSVCLWRAAWLPGKGPSVFGVGPRGGLLQSSRPARQQAATRLLYDQKPRKWTALFPFGSPTGRLATGTLLFSAVFVEARK